MESGKKNALPSCLTKKWHSVYHQSNSLLTLDTGTAKVSVMNRSNNLRTLARLETRGEVKIKMN